MTGNWYQDGEHVNSVAIADRGFSYGDGLFETIAVRNGEPRLWDAHVARLQLACRRLAIQEPEVDTLLSQIQGALATDSHNDGDALVKIIVTRGSSARGYAVARNMDPTILIGVFDHHRPPTKNYTQGIHTRICHSRLATQPQTAGMKLLGRVDQVLARMEWNDPQIAEGIMLDQQGALICGTMSNVFMVKDKRILTPEIVNCGVSGIMRGHILELLRIRRRIVEVAEFNFETLASAGEMFICNSQFGIWPVARCGQKRFSAWPTTRDVMGYLRESGVLEGPP